MAVEQSSDKSRAWKVGAASSLIVSAIGITLYASLGGDTKTNDRDAQAFYTSDDGVTWFKDSAARVPPYQHEGKTANQAVLFTADGGKTQFVGYLQRYTVDVKKRLDAKPGSVIPSIVSYEVKKPNSNGMWISKNTREGMTLANAPAGVGKRVEIVSP